VDRTLAQRLGIDIVLVVLAVIGCGSSRLTAARSPGTCAARSASTAADGRAGHRAARRAVLVTG
jgi:hypothetical protein